jgi:hypothetical protein
MFLGAWLSANGGCTCIIDADKYRGGGGGGDAGGIDAADNVPDAGIPDGRIESDAGPIEPTSAREGEGSGTGAPPVMIVLRGSFEAGSTARVVRSDDETESDLVAEPAVVSGDGSMLAVGIRIPIDENLDEGETATLEIYVDPPSDPEDLIDTFTVEGLDEADLAGAVDTTTLRPLYSSITISASVALAGASPAILRSTSDITVSADVNGSGALGGAAGPGGCPGGASVQPGGCGNAGGGAGASGVAGTGGAGGGHAELGSPGAGGSVGGQRAGNEELTPLSAESGNGGGGGGDGAVLGSGGAGGGGGGVIELTAGGTLVVDDLIDVSGGPGTDGGGLCATGGGSGGGGSGGAILLRAAAIAGAGSIDGSGGTGGDRCNTGGAASAGRIRIDVASEDLPALTADPAPFRGPHWADDTPHVVREAEFTGTMYGQPNTTFAANVDGSDPDDVETNGSGVGSYSITLEPGHNRICAIVSPTANLSLPEAVRCMIVTYVPE